MTSIRLSASIKYLLIFVNGEEVTSLPMIDKYPYLPSIDNSMVRALERIIKKEQRLGNRNNFFLKAIGLLTFSINMRASNCLRLTTPLSRIETNNLI